MNITQKIYSMALVTMCASSSFLVAGDAELLAALDALVNEAKTIELRASSITTANIDKLIADYIALTEKVGTYAADISALPAGAARTSAVAKYNDISARLQNAATKITAAQTKFNDPTVLVVQYMTVYRNLAELVRGKLTAANIKEAEDMLAKLKTYGATLALYDDAIRANTVKANPDVAKQNSYTTERVAYLKLTSADIERLELAINAVK